MSTDNSNTNELQDCRRQHQYFDSELDDLPLTMEAFRVYCHLCRRAGRKDAAFPSYKSIGEACFRGSYPESSPESLKVKAIAAVAELVSWNLLSKKERRLTSGGQTSNLYSLSDALKWFKQPTEKSSLVRKKGSFKGNRFSKTPDNPELPPLIVSDYPPDNPELPPLVVSDYPPDSHELPKGNKYKSSKIEEVQSEESPLTPQRGNAAAPTPVEFFEEIQTASVQVEVVEDPSPTRFHCQNRSESSHEIEDPGLDKNSVAQVEVVTSSKKPSKRKTGLDSETQAWFLEAYLSNKPSNFTDHRKLSPQVCKKIQQLIAEHQDRAIEVFTAALIWVREQKDDWWRKTAQFSLDNLATNGKIEQFAEKHAFALQHDPAYRDRVEGRATSMDAGYRTGTFTDNTGLTVPADSFSARAAAAQANSLFFQ